MSLVPAFRLSSPFPFRATTSGPLSGFTPQSYYLRPERQGQVCTPCSSVFRSVAKRQSPLPHWSARRHFVGSVKLKTMNLMLNPSIFVQASAELKLASSYAECSRKCLKGIPTTMRLQLPRTSLGELKVRRTQHHSKSRQPTPRTGLHCPRTRRSNRRPQEPLRRRTLRLLRYLRQVQRRLALRPVDRPQQVLCQGKAASR